jgi:two-component system CheB/CheR fusion protein
VTEFIRDPDAYEELAAGVIRPVLSGEDAPDEFRIWVAGCASGQEAYSVAMLADEIAREHGYKGHISVFATDIHKRSVQHAGAGIYTPAEVANLSPERLDRYFKISDTGDFRIKPELRQRVVFAQHNLLVDPPFTRMDLVTCRNLLIYLKPNAQDSVLRSLHYALKMGGTLFLGSSESLGELGTAFKTISSKNKIYRKHADFKGHTRPEQLFGQPKMGKATGNAHVPQNNSTVSIDRDLLQAYDLILKRYAPSGVLITRTREVRHYFGDTSRYFAAPEGRADNDFLAMFSGDLKLAISTTLQRVLSKNQAIRSEGVSCTTRHGEEVIDVTVTPYIENERDLGLILVTFEPRAEAQAESESEASESFKAGEETHSRILMLEDELRSTKENLQATVEELQTSNEELQAINEEVQVSNEELQSTNEELHSMNEELYTVNAELEQKNVQLIELNDDHENLLTNTEDGVLYIDRDKRIKKFNPAIGFAFNLLPQDIGRPIEHIAYNLEGQSDMLKDIEMVLESGERSERELRTNTGVNYLRRFTPFRDANGDIGGVVLTFTDITEASQMRSRLARAMESASMAWWEWDLQTDRLDVHAEGECILGYDCDAIDHNSKYWFDRVHPDEVEMVRQSLQDCIDGKTDEWICEHRYARANTDPIEWEWVYEVGQVTRRTASGRPLEMAGTTMNIHARKLLELDIWASMEAAEKALQVKSEFLSVMSHEIRTPLNGICGMAELLDLELEDPKLKHYIEVLTTCSSSLLSLINGILDYSKAESGKLELSPRDYNVEQLAKEVVKIISSTANAKEVSVVTDFKQNGKIYELDDTRIRQVLLNIVGNAVKFSQRGGRVKLEITSNQENKDALEFTVTDQGVGVSPEFMENIFDPFSQEDGSNTRKFGGVGLGLSISKQIVELMGGQIEITSRKEKGTRVRFSILAQAKDDTDQAADFRDGKADGEALSGNKKKPFKKILIVDDDPANMIVLEKMVKQCGYDAQAVPGIKRAVAALSEGDDQFSAALLDLHMPDGTGYDMLEKIKAGETGREHAIMRCYACTADASQETRAKVHESKFDGLLVKPVRLAAVKEVLDGLS